ncbi:hypothetical protein EKD04_005840 [Chloroflexales bacterium ZM16-3]|nr:hypothetical protein [Chloroflexales bacterium ZM16-3]
MNFRLIARAALMLILLGALYPVPSARAQASVSLTATAAFEGNYVPGTWLPITARIENSGTALSAVLAAELPGATIRHIVPVELAGGAQKQVVIYVAMDQSVREVRVSVEQDGSILAEQTLAVRPRSDERMLGLLSGDGLSLSLPRREDLPSQPFTVVSLSPADLPDQVAGLSGLGVLLANNVPPDSLSEAQRGALLAWVNAGGHLFIGGGAADALSGWLPSELQAATTDAQATIDDGPLGELADATGPGPLSGVQLTPLPGGVSVGAAPTPAWVTRSFGQGLVTQFAFDPAAPAMEAWESAPSFWDAILQPTFRVSTLFGQQTNIDVIQEQMLAGTLTALPTIPQPPVDMFFLLLVMYTVLIGPALALFLRRIDRQAWSWLLVPLIAVSSGLLLFTLAISLRTSDKVVSQVSLVEELGNGQARIRTLIGALAPQDQALITRVSPGAITRPVREISGLYGDIGGVSGDLIQQSDQMTLSIKPWKLQGVLIEQQQTMRSMVATIQIGEQGSQIEVINRGGETLRDVVAIYGGRVLLLGNIAPDEQRSGRWAPNQSIAPDRIAIIGQIFADEVAAANRPGQAANRHIELQIAMVNAALYHGGSDIETEPLVLGWVDGSPLKTEVDAPRAAQQSLTLLTMRPEVQVSGPISLPEGWLIPDPTLNQSNACSSNNLIGVRANPAPVTIIMRLPNDLGPLRASALTLTIDSSERWPNAGITTEIYDWAKETWVAQSFDGPGEFEVGDPATYLSEGRLQIRLSGTIERAGCIVATARVQGAMP